MAGSLVLAMILGFFIRSAHVGQEAAFKEIVGRAIFMYSIIFGLVCLLISLGETWGDRFMILAGTSGTILILYQIFTLPMRRRNAGLVLLDVGSPSSGLETFLGVFLAGMSAFNLWRAYQKSDLDFAETSMAALWMAIALQIFFHRPPTLFTDKGIFFFGVLSPWGTFKRYEWFGDDSDILRLEIHRRFWRHIHIRIPRDRKTDAEIIMGRNIPKPLTTV